MTSRPDSLLRAAGGAIQKGKVTESATLGGQGAPTCTECIKDRQQEARAVLVGSRYIGDYYMILDVQCMYHIPLPTLLYGLFIDIKHVKFTGPETKRA